MLNCVEHFSSLLIKVPYIPFIQKLLMIQSIARFASRSLFLHLLTPILIRTQCPLQIYVNPLPMKKESKALISLLNIGFAGPLLKHAFIIDGGQSSRCRYLKAYFSHPWHRSIIPSGSALLISSHIANIEYMIWSLLESMLHEMNVG